MVVAAPLLVLGRPLIRFLWAVPLSWRRPIGLAAISPLSRPASAGLLHGVAIWIWHYPPLFDATLGSDWIHSVQHLSFLVTALLFWWSVFQGPAAAALLNLLIATIHTGVLGALLTFSGSALYPAYAHASIGWSVAPLVDQQLGGLIMWIPGGLSYLAAGMWIASRSLVPARA
jgi:cytochrome c oxidase assembly factor CtaG